MILSKSRHGGCARPLIWRMCTLMAATKISLLLGAFAILFFPVVSCGGCPATPSITSISPSSATAGGTGFTLTVNGGHFSSNAVVVWNGSSLVTTFVSSNQLAASVPSTDIAQADTALVYVYNPASQGETSPTTGVEATDNNGCGSTGSNEVSFTVSP
jgi:hypothetical protein